MLSTSSEFIGFRVLFLVLLFVGCCVSYSGLRVSNKTKEFGGPLNNSTDGDEVLVFGITGGQPIVIGEFPFMAALGWRDETGKLDFLCGGVLISSHMVLTAAHCVYFEGKIPDVVRIGGYPIAEPDYLNGEHNVVNATLFPQYDPNQAYYDIALLELETPPKTLPVCLWTKPNLYVNNVTAIGYGLTAFAGDKSNELLKVNLTVFQDTYCQPFFKRQRKFKSGLSHAHICAGDTNGEKDTCQGDSGGPLIVWHRHRPYAVGITSTGQGCSGFPPAIYTKVSSYIGWIKSVLSENGHTLGRDCNT